MGYQLAQIMLDAGVPKGCCNMFRGAAARARVGRIGAVKTIAFTGSKDVGLGIMQAAAVQQPGQRVVKRVIAEMGGKNAIIVDETADLDEAVTGVVQSFTGYAGQKCSACSRVIVVDSIHDAFLERLSDAVMSLRLGTADDPATQVGPVIDARAKQRILGISRLVGGRAGAGGPLGGRPGYSVGPVVIVDIEPAHRLAQEEIFRSNPGRDAHGLILIRR